MKPTFRAGDFQPDPERDVREEIEAHIEMEAEALMKQGMPEHGAREEARRRFGDRERFQGAAPDELPQDAPLAGNADRRGIHPESTRALLPGHGAEASEK